MYRYAKSFFFTMKKITLKWKKLRRGWGEGDETNPEPNKIWGREVYGEEEPRRQNLHGSGNWEKYDKKSQYYIKF